MLGRNDFELGQNDLGRNGLGAKRPVSEKTLPQSIQVKFCSASHAESVEISKFDRVVKRNFLLLCTATKRAAR